MDKLKEYTIEDLIKLKDLTIEEYLEYKNIVSDAYDSMVELSNKYNLIINEIKNRGC
jgi:hypothetical protein